MKTKLLIVLGCLLGCTAVCAVTGYGQNVAPPVQGVSGPMMPGYNGALGYPPYGAVAVQPGGSEENVPFVSRYRFDSGFGDGLGWDDGFASFGAFVPYSLNSDNVVLFVDARGYVTYQTGSGLGEGGGGNVGAGARYYVPSLNRFFGVSGWIDADGGHEQDFYRAGVSFESIGRMLEFRANGYIPVDDSTQTVFHGFVGDPFFFQNLIILNDRHITENQFGGFDAEIGGPLPMLAKYGISGYVGGYYLHNDDINEDAGGFQARGQANISDDLQAGVRVTHDEVFGTNVWGTVTFTFPRTSIVEWFRADVLRQPSVYNQMDRQVQRNYRIPIFTKTEDTEVAAINPLDGLPFHVAHIDPNAAGGGNGFVETPYNSVNSFVNAADIDIIRVLPGSAANLTGTGPLVLLDNQRLLSSAVNHTFTATQGTFTLPGFTGGALPELFNGAAAAFSSAAGVIQLADNDEVSGFRINGTSGTLGVFNDGIVSQGGGITDFNINRNEFVFVANGVNISHTGNGTGILDQNTATGFGYGALSGFTINHDLAGTLDLTVSSNTATGFLGEDVNANAALDFGEDVDTDTVLDEGFGFLLTADNGTTVNATVTGNTFSANGTGVRMNAFNAATINATVTGNNIFGNINGNTGMHVVADFATVNGTLSNNSFVNNGGTQLQIDALNLGDATFTLEENVFDRSSLGTVGVGINAESGAAVDLTANTLNTFIGGGIGSGPGILALANNSTLNITMVGPTLATGNTFTDNAGAGIAIGLNGASTGTLNFQNNTIIDTVDDADPFTTTEGDGISVALFNTSILQNSTIDGNVIGGTALHGNAGSGIHITATDSSTVSNLLIGNVGADNGDGNLITHNTLDGIFFVRQVNADVDNVRIIDNTVMSNVRHGIDIDAQGTDLSPDLLDFRVEDNVVQLQGQDGIHLAVRADANIDVDIIDNRIDFNSGNGIGTIEQVNDATDLRSIHGNWEANTITHNLLNGISSNAATFDLFVGAVGVDADGKSRGNLIDLNGLDGVLINSPGTAVYTNNTIIRNGGLAVTDTEDENYGLFGHGVDIQGPGYKDLTFDTNTIRLNLGDGVEINDASVIPFALSFVNNDISLNTGRGIDVLNQLNAELDLTVVNNDINGNGGEGIYIVNTSSETQDQSSKTPEADPNPSEDASHGMEADGDIGKLAFINLVIDDNNILGNGANTDITEFASTGLVIRVGTTGGGSSDYTDPGGFASVAVGGIVASINDNVFGGNMGNDAHFESFTSTGDPDNTEGTWSDTEFTVDKYKSDPLARMDLTWTGNTYDSSAFNNLGAFYDNAEADFKSRTDQATDPGPFGEDDADRRRNAERLGFRGAGANFLPPATPGGASDTFLYPGMGQSTFRLAVGSDTTGFILDDSPYDDVTDANGVLLDGAVFGEQPYGWTLF